MFFLNLGCGFTDRERIVAEAVYNQAMKLATARGQRLDFVEVSALIRITAPTLFPIRSDGELEAMAVKIEKRFRLAYAFEKMEPEGSA